MTRLPHEEQLRRDRMFDEGLLWCNFCKSFKPTQAFYKVQQQSTYHATNYGYRRYCVKCEYDQRDKAYIRAYAKSRNISLKAKFVELAGGCCQRCGYSEYVTGLDFHHVYPSKKRYAPAYVIINNDFDRTWHELDKCCLLCASCHAAYEGGEWRVVFVKRDGLGWTVGEPLPLDDTRYQEYSNRKGRSFSWRRNHA